MAMRREVRICRPYGIDVVFSVEDQQSAERASMWWDEQPQEFTLFEGPNGVASQEIVRFKEWCSEQTIQLHNIRAETLIREAQHRLPIVGDSYQATGDAARRGLSSFVLAQDDERVDTRTGVGIRHIEGGLVTEVEMRESSRAALQPAPNYVAIRQVASELGGLDEDVFDIMISNAEQNGPGPDGLFDLEIDAVIAARGRGSKKKREGIKLYSSGVRADSREDVLEALEAFQRIYVATGTGGARKIGDERALDYYQLVTIKRMSMIDRTDHIASVGYQFGPWYEQGRDFRVPAPRSLLALDARNGAPAKALGRYFTQRASEADTKCRIIKPVHEVLQMVRRSTEHGKNPQRLRSWLEDNLEKLVRQHVIDRWEYESATAIESLPRYDWVESWLDLRVVVTLLPLDKLVDRVSV